MEGPCKATSFYLFPPPTLYLSFSLLNNSPSGCMGSRPKSDKPALGVIDFFSTQSCGGGGGCDGSGGGGGKGGRSS